MKSLLRSIVKKHVYLNACLYIAYNSRIRAKFLLNNIKTDSGTTHASLSIDESINYIEDVFHDYQKVSGVKEVHGKVAEVGPGDSAGVALMFLNAGASQVDLADRFYSSRNDDHQRQIYQKLATKYPLLKPVISRLCNKDDAPEVNRFYGHDAAGETFFDKHKQYSYIVSRSVLEHVDNPAMVIKKMYDALEPGGILIHKVDLRDHGMFTPVSIATKFLEVPKWLYKMMVYGTGYPNRFLFHNYKKVIEKITSNYQLYIAGLHGVKPLEMFYSIEDLPENLKQQSAEFINQNRHKFAREFHGVSAEDLMVSSFFFVCRKDK